MFKLKLSKGYYKLLNTTKTTNNNISSIYASLSYNC